MKGSTVKDYVLPFMFGALSFQYLYWMGVHALLALLIPPLTWLVSELVLRKVT